MVPLSRRLLLSGFGGLAGASFAAAGAACSFTARLKPISVSDAACRRSLQALVRLINDAPALADGDLSTRAALLAINFDSNVSDPILNYPNHSPIEYVDLLRAWGSSDGKRDRSPISLREVNMLKGERGVALYQFTLRRDQFHGEITAEEAAGDSCAVPSEAFYGPEDTSYLGLFKNNELREVSSFDAWLRTL